MRAHHCTLLVALLSSRGAAALLVRPAPLARVRAPAGARVRMQFNAPFAEVDEIAQRPDELLGPWEIKSSVSGQGDLWVEFGADGACSCSRSVGKGREWDATPVGTRWRLSFTLLDKLDRPMRFIGEVAPDDRKGLVVSGDVRGPPKRSARATQAEVEAGVVVGEFRGFKLN